MGQRAVGRTGYTRYTGLRVALASNTHLTFLAKLFGSGLASIIAMLFQVGV